MAVLRAGVVGHVRVFRHESWPPFGSAWKVENTHRLCTEIRAQFGAEAFKDETISCGLFFEGTRRPATRRSRIAVSTYHD
jgi:hypothetical protein